MQQAVFRRKWLPWAVGGAVAAILLRQVLLALAQQLLAAYLLMAMALPLCRLLEKRLSPSLSAAMAFAGVTLLALGAGVLLIPPLVRQFRQLGEVFPSLLQWGQNALNQVQAFLTEKGLDIAPVREKLFAQVSQRAGAWVSAAAQSAKQAAQSMGKLFLAPLLAFYLLRDRRRIASLLALAVPVQHRVRAVRAAREMRRETVNFLRGQLLLSAAVGGLTGLGLLITGTPCALALGLLMGVMELIPYIGPVLAGTLAVLLALQGGVIRALWTLGVVLLVQQADSSLLSPRLLSGATNMHPLWVLLLISAGGMLGGPLGMMAVLPLAVSIRGAARGWRT